MAYRKKSRVKFFVHTKPNARKAEMRQIDETHFVIAVKESAHEGKANEAVLRALARYLHIPLAHITLRSGARSKRKVFEVS